MTEAADGSIRIGTAEREAAIAALGDHLAAGRLDIDEYGDRSAQASVARTRDELLSLFTDLPEPRPAFVSRRTDRPAWQSAESANSWQSGPVRPRRAGPPLPARLAMALPLFALMMLLAFHLWFFFLLIPLSGMFFRARAYGAPGRARYQRYEGGCHPGWR